ncbi:MAG: putative signal transducing protein [Betaproteobacteria bacterium]
MKRVFSSFDRIAVFHARNLLEAEGIRATVRNEMLSSVMGELPPAECQAEVWVANEADAALAERILREGTAPAGAPWRCACGEALEGQFQQCWRCGGSRDGSRG